MFQTCFPPEIFYATKAKESFPTKTRMINRFVSVEVSTRGYLVCVYSVNVSDQNVISKKKKMQNCFDIHWQHILFKER